MQQCEKLATCPFFNDKMPCMPTMMEALKRKYCLSDNTGCARLQVSVSGKPIPADLFPNHAHRVAALLAT